MAGQNKAVLRIEASFESALKQFPERKEELLKAVGESALKTVRGYIARSIHDTRGHIQQGQTYTEGSRRGYVAVHPISVKGDKRKNSVRLVTTYLNNGHVIRRTKREDGYYAGRMFYQASIPAVNRHTAEAVKEMEEKLKDDLS